jgi:hypothetical protein
MVYRCGLKLYNQCRPHFEAFRSGDHRGILPRFFAACDTPIVLSLFFQCQIANLSSRGVQWRVRMRFRGVIVGLQRVSICCVRLACDRTPHGISEARC